MPISIVLVLVRKCNKLRESCEIYFTAVLNISLFISELEEHASSHCPILMYGPKVFFVVFKTGEVNANVTMPK